MLGATSHIRHPLLKAKKWLVSFIGVQLAVVLLVSVLWWIFSGLQSSISSLLGGCLAIIPNTVFVWVLLRKLSSHFETKRMLMTLYATELLKMFILAVLAFVVLRYIAVRPLPLLCGLLIVYFLFWLAPISLKKNHI